MARFGLSACIILFLVCYIIPSSLASNHVKRALEAAKSRKLEEKLNTRREVNTITSEVGQGSFLSVLNGKPVDWEEAGKTADNEIEEEYNQKYKNSLQKAQLDELSSITTTYMALLATNDTFSDDDLPEIVQFHISNLVLSWADSPDGKEKLATFIHEQYNCSLDSARDAVNRAISEERPDTEAPAFIELLDDDVTRDGQIRKFETMVRDKLNHKYGSTYASSSDYRQAIHAAIDAHREDHTGLFALIKNVSREGFLQNAQDSEDEEGLGPHIKEGAEFYLAVLDKAFSILESSEEGTEGDADNDITSLLQQQLGQPEKMNHEEMIQLIEHDTDRQMHHWFKPPLNVFQDEIVPRFVHDAVHHAVLNNIEELVSSTAVNIAANHHGKQQSELPATTSAPAQDYNEQITEDGGDVQLDAQTTEDGGDMQLDGGAQTTEDGGDMQLDGGAQTTEDEDVQLDGGAQITEDGSDMQLDAQTTEDEDVQLDGGAQTTGDGGDMQLDAQTTEDGGDMQLDAQSTADDDM